MLAPLARDEVFLTPLSCDHCVRRKYSLEEPVWTSNYVPVPAELAHIPGGIIPLVFRFLVRFLYLYTHSIGLNSGWNFGSRTRRAPISFILSSSMVELFLKSSSASRISTSSSCFFPKQNVCSMKLQSQTLARQLNIDKSHLSLPHLQTFPQLQSSALLPFPSSHHPVVKFISTHDWKTLTPHNMSLNW